MECQLRGLIFQHPSLTFAIIIAIFVALCVSPAYTEPPAPDGPVIIATYERVINPVALLVVLGVVFFILEATVTSYGLLAIGGVTSMALGSLMLIKPDAEFLQLSWGMVAPIIALTAIGTMLLVGAAVRAMHRQPMTGSEWMVGSIGVAKTALAPRGQFAIHGELWEAVSEHVLQPGDQA